MTVDERPTVIVTPWHRQFVKDQGITRDEAAQMLRLAFENIQIAATLYAACEK